MKIAIPIWNDYVSSVFDFAHKLLLIDIENGCETSRTEVSIDIGRPPDRVVDLEQLGVEILICGAISRSLANMVIASGIKIMPYVTGKVDDVLQAYFAGQLGQPRFTMPGHWPGARNGFGRGRRRCRLQRRRK